MKRLSKATVICMGFATLDTLVQNGKINSSSDVGGTAANVCINLNRLKVPAMLVARLGKDRRGKRIISAMQARDIDTRFIELDPSIGTPFCIEELRTSDGEYLDHSFRASILSPYSKSPRFSSPKPAVLERAIALSPDNIVYSNKQIPYLPQLIKVSQLPLFYEPDCIDDWELHEELCKISTITKFCHQQFIDFAENPFKQCSGVIIETFGGNGIVFKDKTNGRFYSLRSQGGDKVVDSTGAGDWFSSGLISRLVDKGNLLLELDDLRFALKIARMSCSYLGANGMSELSELPDGRQLSKIEVREIMNDYKLN